MDGDSKHTVESALLKLLTSAGIRVRMGMKYGDCGSVISATETRILVHGDSVDPQNIQ